MTDHHHPLPVPDYHVPFHPLTLSPLPADFLLSLPRKGEADSRDERAGPDNPAPLDNLRLGEAEGEIVGQVADTVEEVEGEGPGDEELETTLGGEREGTESGDEGLALDVPAEEGRDEVGAKVDVESGRETTAGDTGPDGGAEPGLLHLVDCQVRGDGAAEALLCEKLEAILGGELGGCDGAVRLEKLVSIVILVHRVCWVFGSFCEGIVGSMCFKGKGETREGQLRTETGSSTCFVKRRSWGSAG